MQDQTGGCCLRSVAIEGSDCIRTLNEQQAGGKQHVLAVASSHVASDQALHDHQSIVMWLDDQESFGLWSGHLERVAKRVRFCA